MKIDYNFIKNLFSLKIKVVNQKDKIKLSNYEEHIPMYDIYSKAIYPINKKNIHTRLIDYHYRFINEEVYEWIKLLCEKNKNNELYEKYNKLLQIMDNYDINTLIETSYKTLYKFSPHLGLSVSICKRNSFHPYINHLKPYYSKLELIKLGQNMKMLETNIDPTKLIDQALHYSICKSVSNNDVSFIEIESHHNHIIDTNNISWITFYSNNGSFIFNKLLRYDKPINSFYSTAIRRIVECIKNAPPLLNDYYIYRFIWDDHMIHDLPVGNFFIDKGFISTTRDPFYSPGLSGHFGLILIKINIPKGKKGVGLFIENFSLFPNEQEFLLPPNTKLKLLSKNENFKYYHTNPEFEKIINRKYEFELIETDWSIIESLKQTTSDEEYTDIKTIQMDGENRIFIIKEFLKRYVNTNSQICITINNIKYKMNYMWFDTSASYEKLYYNKTTEGMIFSIFDNNGYPYINIELGQDMVINYINKFYFHNAKTDLSHDHLDLILEIGRIFYYKKCIIFNNFNNFAHLGVYTKNMFLYISFYNKTQYEYIKDKTIYLKDPFITYENGYWKLDNFLKNPIPDEFINKLPEQFKNMTNNSELISKLTIKDHYLYTKIINNYDTNIFKNCYVIYNIYEKLSSSKRIDNFHDIKYGQDEKLDDDFKMIFRQPIRRL